MKILVFVAALFALLPSMVSARPNLPSSDWKSVNIALELAKSNTAIPWTSASTGTKYEVTPMPAFRDADGRICRHFVLRSDSTEQTLTACRYGTEDWRLAP